MDWIGVSSEDSHIVQTRFEHFSSNTPNDCPGRDFLTFSSRRKAGAPLGKGAPGRVQTRFSASSRFIKFLPYSPRWYQFPSGTSSPKQSPQTQPIPEKYHSRTSYSRDLIPDVDPSHIDVDALPRCAFPEPQAF